MMQVWVRDAQLPCWSKGDHINLALPNISRFIRIWPNMTENEVSNEKERNTSAENRRVLTEFCGFLQSPERFLSKEPACVHAPPLWVWSGLNMQLNMWTCNIFHILLVCVFFSVLNKKATDIEIRNAESLVLFSSGMRFHSQHAFPCEAEVTTRWGWWLWFSALAFLCSCGYFRGPIPCFS